MLKPLHQGISVTNMEESIQWYQNMLGFELISNVFEEALNAKVAFLRQGDFEIELFEYMGADKKPLPQERTIPNEDIKTCGAKHIAYLVEDMDAFIAELKSKNVDIAAGPFPMHEEKVCFIRDNNGVLIELIQR